MNNFLEGFFEGKKIFLTGHTGFKGSWLSLQLHSLGSIVTGYSLEPPTKPSLYEMARVNDCVDSIYGDICNFEQLNKSIIAADGEKFQIGKISLQLIHTPGHTMESSCYLLRNENDKEIAVFTGDTLFLGDVGRPDLAQENKSMTKEYLAGQLFDSIRNKLMPLPDNITIYPAHGAGSACGKNMMDLTSDSLANQKKLNSIM